MLNYLENWMVKWEKYKSILDHSLSLFCCQCMIKLILLRQYCFKYFERIKLINCVSTLGYLKEKTKMLTFKYDTDVILKFVIKNNLLIMWEQLCLPVFSIWSFCGWSCVWRRRSSEYKLYEPLVVNFMSREGSVKRPYMNQIFSRKSFWDFLWNQTLETGRVVE
jgi:hypothetical protein